MRVAFVASPTPEAQRARDQLARENGAEVDRDDADVIVALGGDGFMLETLHSLLDRPRPIYGMNLGTVGFLLNEYHRDGLVERISNATRVELFPLRMRATLLSGEVREGLGINEVSIFRETRQAAAVRIDIDGVTRMPELICDGILIATAAGSTAYNLSAHGPIVPLGAKLVALTPISPFRPRRWRGALLPSRSCFSITVLDPAKRPVSATADYTELRDVASIEIWEDPNLSFTLLFDPEHNLEERILKEQFIP